MSTRRFHATSMFTIYKDIFDTELGEIRDYINETASYFQSKTFELNHAFANTDDSDYQDRISDEYFKHGIHFPKILHASVLISLQTMIEKTLQLLVEKCESLFGAHKFAKKLPGENDINHYCRILNNAYGIDCQDHSEFRRVVNEYRLLRNLFVHHGGNLRSEKRLTTKIAIEEIVNNSDEQLLLAEPTKQIVIDCTQYLLRYGNYITAMMHPIFDQLICKHTTLIKSNL